MLYKFTPFGYFARTAQISRGPWFDETNVEEDGMEILYSFVDDNGNRSYLLSNNMKYEDRAAFENLYRAHRRAMVLAMGAGLWIGVEASMRL